jgi:DNA polymerase III epsilon subunit-like protein
MEALAIIMIVSHTLLLMNVGISLQSFELQPSGACHPELNSHFENRIKERNQRSPTADSKAPSSPPLVTETWDHSPQSPAAVSPHSFYSYPVYSPHMAHRFVALDCEMVGVGPGGQRSVLARVSVVNFNGTSLFDTFVTVQEKVTDYRTFVSGVRAEDLVSPNAMDFGECRRYVQKLIANKVLIGHALQNDLQVLQITHPWYNIRDTSIYHSFMQIDYHGMWRPRRLRDLARQHLGVLIQQAGQEHDSKEDACAAMGLYKLVQNEWDSMIEWRRRTMVLQAPLHSLPIM